MLVEFIFGVWVKIMQLTQWMVLFYFVKEVFYKRGVLYIKMSEDTNLTYYQIELL